MVLFAVDGLLHAGGGDQFLLGCDGVLDLGRAVEEQAFGDGVLHQGACERADFSGGGGAGELARFHAAADGARAEAEKIGGLRIIPAQKESEAQEAQLAFAAGAKALAGCEV